MDMPLQRAVSPERAAVERPIIGCGDFTIADVMLTIRPNRRSFMPSITPWIMNAGASRLASRAPCQSWLLIFVNSPGGGPALLLTRMSGASLALSKLARPSAVLISATTDLTSPVPTSRRVSCAAISVSLVLPLIVIVATEPSFSTILHGEHSLRM